ncbi:aminopeptidase [Papillibacter cinnamivorans]|uniref:M18 family aminopeptidase n=1 Tax=Papillibacter cinnamivorans DSM 12816 TaxID=1122930 RepID=A0A1W1YJA3_9FIRM|nr:aminopeptidase [Papillibacter cinnamivorans]SMC36247.1 Aspartyl aminopeptidase [Papillibacter cinnamivorans DSM 12816]
MDNKVESAFEKVKNELFYQQKNSFDLVSPEDLNQCNLYCSGYKRFLDESKTEREAVAVSIRLAEEKGFRPYVRGMAVKAGDKLYFNNRDKALILAVVGTRPLSDGVHIGAAHIDAPRLDLKQHPLYEEAEMAYFKTHYYGGVRKYQWVAVPLELRGAVALKDGSVVNVSVGAGPDDPLFVITDLLPHLASEQSKKPLGEAIPGESLNILLGSRPFPGTEKDTERVKLMAMSLIHEKYGITEADFLSADLCMVPAMNARDLGFDRSLIGAYGHDDRVCAYAAFAALLGAEAPEFTAVCVLADKEETGSDGVSGMQSAAFDTFIGDLCRTQGVTLDACFEKSRCLSADVTVAFDPSFPEVYEKRNAARINYGVGLCKYTGSRGKSGSSDASAELIAYFRGLFDKNNVSWQMAEMGAVDAGGGGTVAKYMANRNIDTLDAGVAVLSMHSPYEVVSKLDCYMTYKSLLVFYKAGE